MKPSASRAFLSAVLLSTTLAACNAESAAPMSASVQMDSYASAGSSLAAPAPAAEEAAGRLSFAGERQQDRKIIRTGQLSLSIDDYASSKAELDKVLAASRGFVARADVQHVDGKVTHATLVLRLPSDGFADAVAAIGKLGTVTAESFGADDVTGEWVDLAARLANSKRLEGRLVELAAKDTDNVQELLEVERELARVRGEIEQMEARQKTLADQVSLGTLTLDVTTRTAYVAMVQPSLGDDARRALAGGWRELTDLGREGLLGILAFLPWLPLFLLAAYALRRGWRRLAGGYGVAASGQPKQST